MVDVREALEQLRDKGFEGSYPRGCIHDEEDVVEFDADIGNWNTCRICSKCLEELLEK